MLEKHFSQVLPSLSLCISHLCNYLLCPSVLHLWVIPFPCIQNVFFACPLSARFCLCMHFSNTALALDFPGSRFCLLWSRVDHLWNKLCFTSVKWWTLMWSLIHFSSVLLQQECWLDKKKKADLLLSLWDLLNSPLFLRSFFYFFFINQSHPVKECIIPRLPST